MTLQQCRYLIEIAKYQSLNKAAAALYVTQPSLSKAIRNLEMELSITIFERTNKGVLFTEQGRELLFHAQKLVAQAESVVYQFTQKPGTPLKYAISSQHYSFAIEAFARFMQLFNQEYELSIREGKTTDVIDDVYTSRSILGVVSITDLNEHFFARYFTSKSLTFQQLETVKQHVFLREKHPLAAQATVHLDDLEPYPYLTYQQNDMMLHFAEETLNLHDRKQLVYLKDRGAMNNLLAHTNGFNLGTGCIVKGYMNSNITSRPLIGGSSIRIGYIKRDDTVFSNEIVQFVDELTQSLHHSLPKTD
ncbi:hypothetical protein DH09_16460 [Bacillaceae bacterium JMAK1]|nr:hypothetical protein DH09_16460 [Bacillaceae bacterium JMAK1]